MIAYKKTNGMAHDIRFVVDSYSPELQEIILSGDSLPDAETLHDADYILARDTAISNEIAKEVQKINDIETNLPTWQQISDRIDNATTLAMIKIIIKKLARVVYWLAKNKAT